MCACCSIPRRGGRGFSRSAQEGRFGPRLAAVWFGLGGGTNLGFITVFSVYGGPTWVGSNKQHSSTREMGKNHNSIIVLGISLILWWMIPMDARDNHTKDEHNTER